MAKRNYRYDYKFKILIIGDSCVGKTTIIQSYTEAKRADSLHIATVGVDFKTKKMKLNEKTIELQLWDTAGQERFMAITKAYYRDAHGIMLVYDVTNGESFEHLSRWIRNVDENSNEKVLKMIIGNKCDLSDDREVLFEKGKQLADAFKLDFYETSAKDDYNITKAFEDMAAKLMENEKNTPQLVDSQLSNQLYLNTSTNSNQPALCCSYSSTFLK